MQTFTVPSAMRGGSPNPIVLGPFAVPAGTTEIQVSSTMADADIASTTPIYTIEFAVEVQYGAGRPFDPAASMSWKSGPAAVGAGGIARPPGLNVPVAPSATQVQARLTIPTAVKVGANVTVLP